MNTLLRGLVAPVLAATALLAGASALSAAEADTTYRYRAIDYPGAANTALYAINVRGHYVGAMKDAVTGAHHAVHGQGGSIKLLDPDGPVGHAKESWAFTTNGLGQIGGVYLDDAGVRHGFILHPGGTVQSIDMPGAFGTQVYGLNDRGQFIGLYSDAAGADHAYVNRNGTFENADLPDGVLTVPLSINDSGQIVGEFVKTEGTTGYGYIQYTDGRFTLHTAPDSPPEQTFFISMNNRRQILGAWFDADGFAHNFIRRHGRYTPFDLPDSMGAIYVQAETINDQGDVVGYWFDSNWVAHGFWAN